jgi:hypothetical protein
VIIQEEDRSPQSIIEEYSETAGLTIIGFHSERLRHEGTRIFNGYQKLGNVLFVNAHSQKVIQ